VALRIPSSALRNQASRLDSPELRVLRTRASKIKVRGMGHHNMAGALVTSRKNRKMSRPFPRLSKGSIFLQSAPHIDFLLCFMPRCLPTGGIMKISARNQFKGKIVSIKEGAVNGIVIIDIGGGNRMSATISMDSIRELGLQTGGEAYAVVKATSVMVGVDQ
jgi:molybdopterin-binding protein